jgi:hypothetical protein
MAVLDLNVGGTRMRARVSDGTVVREGETLHISALDCDLHLFDAKTGQRLEDPEPS